MLHVVVGAAAWHPAASVSAQEFADKYVRPGMTVLDVGGRDVVGANKDAGSICSPPCPGARYIFERAGANYTCQDMEADASVDVVSPPGKPLPFADGAFDIVFSSSVFEHDPMFWMTLREMARVTRLNGTIYSAAPSAGPYHAWPGDNFRFMKDAPAALAFWCGTMNEGHRYPLKVVDQEFMADRMTDPFNMNAMVWKRTDVPTTRFTMSKKMEPTNDDLLCYATRYPDLAKAYGNDMEALQRHWSMHGKTEGRDPYCHPTGASAAHVQSLRTAYVQSAAPAPRPAADALQPTGS